ncbi:PPC domain-containing protein [Tundrisphaera sp. TA3]|uniref:PPC domain-containing protein n=1 Tax=Tundrisphaera sp. TA3 TaxID=3435775 RepID=UPI003EBAFDC4
MVPARKSLLVALSGLALPLVLSLPARAAFVVENEANGASTNNTLATAQAISADAFTLPTPANVFNPPGYATATITGRGGSGDVDFYSFVATTAGQLLIDIDNNPFTFDTNLALFNSVGTLLAFGEDSNPADPGSQVGLDAFIGTYTLTSPGTYYIAVSSGGNNPTALANAQFTTLFRPDGSPGGSSLTSVPVGVSTYVNNNPQPSNSAAYTMQISFQGAQAVVPEPSSIVMVAVGAIGLAGFGIRQHRKGD